jgi:cell wall-associated NlpC family hydrolase
VSSGSSVKLATLVVCVGLAAGCASAGGGGRPRPFPTPGSPPSTDRVPVGSGAGASIATTALSYQGVPYRPGGSDPAGFDCSGLVQYVLARHGISWPRVVRDQYDAGYEIGPNDLQPGDLLFFATESRRVSHVGIAIGGDRFVHAPNARGVVRVESLSSSYWLDRYVGARRPVGAGE